MAVADTLINLFPSVTGSAILLWDAALVVGALSLAGGWATWAHRHRRRDAVRLAAIHHGLTEDSARFVARTLGGDGPDTVRMLLRTPLALRQRLTSELGAMVRPEIAARFATQAAALAGALRLREPTYPSAPLLFEEIELRDPQDGAAPPVRGWVVQVDDARLAVVSPAPCPWPVRKDLLMVRVHGSPYPWR